MTSINSNPDWRPDNWPPKWRGKVWNIREHGRRQLTEPRLFAFWIAMPHDHEMRIALGADEHGFLPMLGGRLGDRAFQLLRKAGLARFNRERREWERTS